MDVPEEEQSTVNFDIVVDINEDIRGLITDHELNATRNVSVHVCIYREREAEYILGCDVD